MLNGSQTCWISRQSFFHSFQFPKRCTIPSSKILCIFMLIAFDWQWKARVRECLASKRGLTKSSWNSKGSNRTDFSEKKTGNLWHDNLRLNNKRWVLSLVGLDDWNAMWRWSCTHWILTYLSNIRNPEFYLCYRLLWWAVLEPVCDRYALVYSSICTPSWWY